MGLFDSLVGKSKSFSELNRYVNDFKIVEETDKKGRLRKRALYTGPWTVLRDPGPRSRWLLGAALALSLLTAGVYVPLLLLIHAASGQLVVMVPLLIGLFPLLYLLMGALSLPFRGGPMRRDQYMHSFIRASRSGVAVASLAAAGLAASFIWRAVAGDWLFLGEDIRFCVSCAAAAALALGVVAVLRRVDLTEKENAAYEARLL